MLHISNMISVRGINGALGGMCVTKRREGMYESRHILQGSCAPSVVSDSRSQCASTRGVSRKSSRTSGVAKTAALSDSNDSSDATDTAFFATEPCERSVTKL